MKEMTAQDGGESMEEFSYIVLDLEWNQPMSGQEIITRPFRFDSEIIEIGALKLNNRFEEMSEFKSFVRPVFYPSMNGHVVQLTKIRPQELEKAPDFPAAYAAFRDWCGEDCCLCTWGPDDLPVLMDNLLMHGLDAALPDGYDLQRIFGHEIMRDDRQCSLERAMELLRLKPDRAHDALNDARNTVRICGSIDLERCMEEYCLRYIGYGPDRLAGRVGGLPYPDLPAAQADPQLTALTCPYCGQPLTLGEWTRKDGNTMLAYARCNEGDEYLAVCRYGRTPEGIRMGRMVYEMSDDLWDVYQRCIERQA